MKLTAGQIFERLEKHAALPHDEQAEIGVVAEMLMSPEFCSETISRIGLIEPDESPFVSDWHTDIYRSACRLHEKGDPVDFKTVARELRTFTAWTQTNIVERFQTALRGAGNKGNAGKYLDAILKDYRLRKLILGCQRVVAIASSPEFGEDDARDELEQILFDLSEGKSEGAVTFASLIDEILIRMETPKIKLRGVLSGIQGLDTLTNGFQRGDLIVVIAKSGDGKSSLGLHLAAQAASLGTITVFFSGEMKALSVGTRTLANFTGVNSFDIKRGNLSPEDKELIHREASNLRQKPIFVDEQSNISPLEIKGRLRKMLKHHKIGLVVVDYFQLLGSSDKKQNRENDLSNISRSLKGVAMDLNLPVILLAQVNKDNERQGRRIKLSDIRECEALRMDADLGIAIIWDDPNEETRGIELTGILDLQKHRDGPTGEVKVLFDRATSRYRDLDINWQDVNKRIGADNRYETEPAF